MKKVKLKKESMDFGLLMVTTTQEKKDSQVYTQTTSSGFQALRDHTLSADYSAEHSRKESRRATVRKERDQDLASIQGQKVKVMQHGKMTGPTQLSEAKEKKQR